MSKSQAKPVSKNDLELERIRGANRAKQIFARGCSFAVPVAFSGIPLWVMYKCVAELAGEETVFSTRVGISLSVAITGIPLAAWVWALKRQLQKQREELIRLRERATNLEERLQEADKGKA